MKLTDILKDVNKRENNEFAHVIIYSDGSGSVKDEDYNNIFEWNKNDNLSETILKAYKKHYQIDNETLTL